MKSLPEYSVRDLMQKNITFIKETESLENAIRIMSQKKVTSLIVEKEHPQDAYGIITRKDLIIELSENWDSLKTLKVSDLATKPVISIEAGVGVKHAARLMRLAGVRRLVVYESDKLVGIISNADLFQVVLKAV
ncbi:MAG: CBS domain-containing protein [Deltaproteobacteria bacterium]|nr:MAG: CBS domain-containing protein [Deltaproteobacteria bacterium]